MFLKERKSIQCWCVVEEEIQLTEDVGKELKKPEPSIPVYMHLDGFICRASDKEYQVSERGTESGQMASDIGKILD